MQDMNENFYTFDETQKLLKYKTRKSILDLITAGKLDSHSDGKGKKWFLKEDIHNFITPKKDE